MVTISKAIAIRLDCRCLCVLFTIDRGIGHEVSATASINQPRSLRFIAYVMADLAIMVCGFGYVSQKPNSYFDIEKPKMY